jgi:hypothetical protein
VNQTTNQRRGQLLPKGKQASAAYATRLVNLADSKSPRMEGFVSDAPGMSGQPPEPKPIKIEEELVSLADLEKKGEVEFLRPLKTWMSSDKAQWKGQDAKQFQKYCKELSEPTAAFRTKQNKVNAKKIISYWVLALRGAWDRRNSKQTKQVFENLLSARRLSVWGAPFGRAAFQFHLGYSHPVFEPRDLLDWVAYTILQASKRGLLRMCQGHKEGWNCPTPYLVADEKRRVYCYMHCGNEAKSKAKLAWWRKNRPSKRRHRAA